VFLLTLGVSLQVVTNFTKLSKSTLSSGVSTYEVNPIPVIMIGLTQIPYFPEGVPSPSRLPPVFEGFALKHPVERIIAGLKGRSPFLK
jgi:hypothetical protein